MGGRVLSLTVGAAKHRRTGETGGAGELCEGTGDRQAGTANGEGATPTGKGARTVHRGHWSTVHKETETEGRRAAGCTVHTPTHIGDPAEN